MEYNEVLGLGPTVAIIDDEENEVRSLEDALDDRRVGHKFFHVDMTNLQFPAEPITTIQLIFLDLNYDNGFGASRFEPEVCSQWLKTIVPAGHRYALVIWSKDGDLTDELLESMEHLGAPPPFFVDTKLKDEYRTGDKTYNIDQLLSDLNISVEKEVEISTQEYYGQIIAVEDRDILINCLLHEEPPTFEVRRFDRKPFNNYINLEKGKFVQIRVTTKPGEKKFEFIEDPEDRSELFKQDNNFEDLEDLSFLME